MPSWQSTFAQRQDITVGVGRPLWVVSGRSRSPAIVCLLRGIAHCAGGTQAAVDEGVWRFPPPLASPGASHPWPLGLNLLSVEAVRRDRQRPIVIDP
jgi:hypothetical protein